MIWEIVVLTIILIVNLFILFSVLKADVAFGKVQRRIFAGMMIWVILWVISILITDLYFQETMISLWASRISFVSSILISLTYYFFVRSFESTVSRQKSIVTGIFTFLGLVAALFSLTPLVVENVTVVNGLHLASSTGALYGAVAAYYILTFIVSTYIFYLKWKVETNAILKTQILYIIIGVSISMSLALFTNIFLPAVASIEIRALGPLSLIFFLFSTAYSIVRSRFMSLRQILGRAVYALAVIAVPYFSFYLASYIQTEVWGSVYALGALISGIFVAILFMVVLEYVSGKLDKVLKRTLIHSVFDPEQTMDKLISQLSKEMRMELVLERFIDILSGVYATNSVYVRVSFPVEKTENHAGKGFEDLNNESLSQLNLVANARGGLLVTDELLLSQLTQADSRVADTLNENKIEVVATFSSEVEGLVIIGRRAESAPLSVEDITFLRRLVDTFSISVDRASLYSRVQNSADSLQIEVDKATVELQKQNQVLERTLRKERDMLDILGHELRTPLGIFRNSVQMLKMWEKNGQSTPERRIEYLDKSEENAIRLAKLLETIFSSTKIDNDRLVLSAEPVDMVDVVNDTLEGLRKKAEQKGLEVILDLKPTSVYSDRARTQEIADNLIDNAIKYTQAGSITIKVEPGEGFGKLIVQDTGKGISKEVLSHLGQKFYRADNYLDSSKDLEVVRAGGTGLGLYVTFNLAKAMGGEVTVDSDEGKGSTFTAMIPTYVGQEVRAARTAQEEINQKFKQREVDKATAKNSN